MSVYQEVLNKIALGDYITVGSNKVVELSFEDFDELIRSDEALNQYIDLPVYEDVLSTTGSCTWVDSFWSTLVLNIEGSKYTFTNTLGLDISGYI